MARQHSYLALSAAVRAALLSGWRSTAVPGAVGVLACLGLAAASYRFPTVMLAVLGAAGLGIPVVWLIWTRPELGLLALISLTAGLLRGADLYVPLPLGGLYPHDVVLLGLFGLVAIRGVLVDGLRIDWWPVSKPLLVFLALVLLSVVNSVAFRGVEVRQALNELRPLAYYAVAILTLMTIQSRNQRVVLLVGCFVLADVIAAALFLQQLAGVGSLLLPGMSEWQVDEVGASGMTDTVRATTSQGFGLVRIVPPAHVLLFIMSVLGFVWTFATDLRRSVRLVCACQFVFLNAGMLLTYTRAQWIASVISLTIVTLLLPRPVQMRVVRWLVAVCAVVLVGLAISEAGVKPPVEVPAVGALVSRATSTLAPDQTFSSSSLQWRAFEIEEAVRSLTSSPQGVGLGNAYRPVTTYAGEAAGYQGREPLNRFMHNSYLYIGVKTGLQGLAAFVWFCLAFLANGWIVYRRLPVSQDRWLVLALVACFVGILQWSFTEANFMQTSSTVVVGLLMGVAGGFAPRPAHLGGTA